MRIQILQSAKEDLIAAHRFYEEKSQGIGDYFIESLIADIESLRISHGIHTIYFDKYHRLLSKKFPFAVYYRVEKSIIRIYAVLDCRRNPAWQRKKLSKLN